uniref:Uncharacterized protein n=1 Tax=Lepeophtheirus salmonis TaxID=72036 RepID=A0A0K2VKD0_LEPSM
MLSLPVCLFIYVCLCTYLISLYISASSSRVILQLSGFVLLGKEAVKHSNRVVGFQKVEEIVDFVNIKFRLFLSYSRVHPPTPY